MNQVEYFVDAVSDYESDFILFPELFNAPLMGKFNNMECRYAIKELAQFTEPLVEAMSKLAVSYNVNIIAGSMPELRNENLYNVYNLKFTDFINYKLLNYIKELNNTNIKITKNNINKPNTEKKNKPVEKIKAKK